MVLPTEHLALPPVAAFGIATPLAGDAVRMTNHAWAFSIEALRLALGFERLVFINDFTALALALPQLKGTELEQIGGGTPRPVRDTDMRQLEQRLPAMPAGHPGKGVRADKQDKRT